MLTSSEIQMVKSEMDRGWQWFVWMFTDDKNTSCTKSPRHSACRLCRLCMHSDPPITLVLIQCAESDQPMHMEWVAGNNIEKWATNKRKSQERRLGAKKKSNVNYLELFRLQEGWYWPNACSVSTVCCICCHNEITPLICLTIYIGTTQQCPAPVLFWKPTCTHHN